MDDLDISFDKISKTPSPAGSALTGDKEVGASSEGGQSEVNKLSEE